MRSAPAGDAPCSSGQRVLEMSGRVGRKLSNPLRASSEISHANRYAVPNGATLNLTMVCSDRGKYQVGSPQGQSRRPNWHSSDELSSKNRVEESTTRSQ